MHIQKFAIDNYKSYLKPQEMQLSRGFNIVVGTNNAGKTALVEALSFNIENKPHRSLETIPLSGGLPASPTSRILVTFEIHQEEFRQIIFDNFPDFNIGRNRGIAIEPQRDKVLEAFKRPTIHIEAIYHSKRFVYSRIVEMEMPKQPDYAFQFRLKDLNEPPVLTGPNIGVDAARQLDYLLVNLLYQNIYHFRAERFNIGQYPIGVDPVLKSDASNLAQVLNLLQTKNPARFDRLINLAKIVFPDIKDVTVPPMQENPGIARIHLWSVEKTSERDDLAVPLQDSGTGVGQILAILYIAVTSVFPKTIIIDEPQSFLHPAAIRKLFGILKQEFSQHQYIATTHSPLVVSVSHPEQIILLRKENTTSQIVLIEKSQTDDLRSLLAEVGARLSDVFGADKVLWVEGSTEEECFPLIVNNILKLPLLGTALLGVLNVGDLESKHKETVYRIYERLSRGNALLPPAIGFIFDKEGRSDKEQEDIIRASNGKVQFLPRRMYENYLINADAIAHLIFQLDGFSENEIMPQYVADWIKNNRWKSEYFRNLDSLPTKDDDTWFLHVHGKDFLNDLLLALSDKKYSYDQVRYGKVLTAWLIDNNPNSLNDVKNVLDKALKD